MNHTDFAYGRWGKSWDEACADDAARGIANLSGEGIILDLSCDELLSPPGMIRNGVAQPSEAECLFGYSQDGYALLLGNAVYCSGNTHFPGMTCQKIRADYLMAAKGCKEFFPSDPIEKIEIELRNLVDWYGRPALYATYDEHSLAFKSLEYRKGDYEPRILLSDKNYEISLVSSCTISGLEGNETAIERKCNLQVLFSSERSLDEARNLAFNLSQFFSLCMGFHAQIQKLDVYFKGGHGPVQYFAPLLDSPSPPKSAVDSMPFPHRVLEQKIDSCLGNWLDHCSVGKGATNGALIKRAGDVVTSILTYDWKMPVELLCVAASQALEAISKYGAELKAWNKTERKQLNGELLNRIDGMPKSYVEWVRKQLSHNSKGARRLMNKLMERQRDITEWLVPNAEQFVSELLKARNTYAHGSSAGADSPSEIYWLSMGSAIVGFAILWRLLGLSPDEVRSELERSRYKAQVTSWLRDRYCMKD